MELTTFVGTFFFIVLVVVVLYYSMMRVPAIRTVGTAPVKKEIQLENEYENQFRPLLGYIIKDTDRNLSTPEMKIYDMSGNVI